MNEPLVDTIGAIDIYAEVTGRKPAVDTFRRYPIPYRRPHGIREYAPSAVREYAQRRIAEAPVIIPAQTPRRRKGGRPMPLGGE
jgi:hypothetical protein